MTARLTLALVCVLAPALRADSGLITTVAGNGVQGSAGTGGPATAANLNYPYGVCVDRAGNLYIADWGNSRIVRVSQASGILEVAAGTGQQGYNGDGGPATAAALNGPFACAVDAAGNLLIADSGNHVIRRVEAQSGVITTIAGNGVAGFAGDGGPAILASLLNPTGLALDAAGNLFIADSHNHRVRRVDAGTGVITTVAGSGESTTPYNADGKPAIEANLCYPTGVVLDGSGNLYLSDLGNWRILRVDAATGIIQTIAGNGDQLFGGDGRLATTTGVGQTGHLVLDGSGYLYFAAGNTGRVQRVNLATGIIVTVAGNGTVVSSGPASSGSGGTGGTPPTGTAGAGSPAPGDGGRATAAIVDRPAGLAIAANGNLFVSEASHRVRQVFLPAPYAYTATNLVSSSSSITDGDPVTFTATVSPVEATGAPTGTVEFVDLLNQTPVSLATVTLESGTASVTVPLAAGQYGRAYHQITALYSGDSAFANSASPQITQEVKWKSSVTLSSDRTTSDAGQTVTLTAQVLYTARYAPSGTIEFRDGDTTLGTVYMTGTSASLSTAFQTSGEHRITAIYSGNLDYAGSSSPVLVQTVRTASTTTIVSSPNPSLPGQAVTVTASVSPAAATGTVQFLSDGAPFAAATVVNGVAAAAIASLASGSHNITAVYSGDSNYTGSTSASLGQFVKTATTVTVSANPSSRYGDVVRLSALLSPAAATGAVTFFDGGTVLGTSTAAGGQANLSVSSLAPGDHAITAAYSGDGTYAGSTSPVFIHRVLQANPTVVAGTSPNPSVWGQAVTLTATVTPAQATGTVQFFDGTTLVWAGTLANGRAAIAVASLTVGSHSITVYYGGDGYYLGTTSPATIQVVNRAPVSVAVTSSLNPSTRRQAVTFTATVAPAAATGTVQFLDGTASLGTVAVSAGRAAITVTLLEGTHSITVKYSGNSQYLAGVSPVLIQTVTRK